VLGEVMTNYLLGDERSSDDHTWWSLGNGVLLRWEAASAFPHGQIALIPVQNGGGKPAYRWPTAEPLMRRFMARIVVKELNWE
jgi:hypothetical protein